MTENKKAIVEKLTEVLKLTRHGYDISLMEYSTDRNGEEFANIYFIDGSKQRVCITADSGVAIILDITRAIM